MANPILTEAQASKQSIYEIVALADAEHLPGTVGMLDDGRRFRYVYNESAVTYPVGQLLVSNVTAHNDQVAAVNSIGQRRVTFTAGAVCVARQFLNGYLALNLGTALGHSYRIVDHPVLAAAAAQWVLLEDGLTVATDATTEFTLMSNPCWSPQISVVDQLDLPVGVPLVAITDDTCGWVQYHGECAVLAGTGAAAARGTCLTIDGGVGDEGAVGTKDADIEAPCGISLIAQVDTEYLPVYLSLGYP